MIPPEPRDRFPTRAACDRLNAEFGFTSDAFMQDWEIELSDGKRLQEFLDGYSTLDLNDDERFALMALIAASAHDALEFHGMGQDHWQPIRDMLVADSKLHASTIYDWCCVDATCEDECFTLSSQMRDVWNKAFPMTQMDPVPTAG